MNDAVEIEIAPPVDDKLVKYAGETGLEKPATETLVEAFRLVFAKSRAALNDARGVAESVKDATCVTEIRRSRACRLAIRAVRLESDETRKKHKQHALLYGRAVDGFHNILLADLAPVETALQEAEDIAERAEAARKALVRELRFNELMQFTEPSPHAVGDLSELSEEQYAKVLGDAKLLRQAKIDAAAKAKADAEAKAEAERIERERIAAENARLRAEKEEADKAAKEVARLAEVEHQRVEAERAKERRKAKDEADRIEAERAEERRLAKVEADRLAEIARKERESIEAKAKAERDKAAKETARLKAELAAKEKAAADAKAKLEAERQAAEKDEREAAAAPDKAKLVTLASAVRQLPQPALRNETLGVLIADRVEQLAVWIETQKPEDKL